MMGDTLTNSEAFYGDLLDHYQDLLDHHYHHLTRVIRPHLFYGWLRAKCVFTQADQEEVENKYYTTIMKAGCLIDIIKTKGRSGFISFLEVIEYEYGDLFLEVTEKQPRSPPREFDQGLFNRINSTKGSGPVSSRQQTISSDVLAMIGELTGSLTKEIAYKSHELRRLHGLLTDVKAEHEQVLEENSVMFGDLKSARETIDELKQENVEQMKRNRQMKDERDKLQTECSQLREQKDVFMDQCHQLRKTMATLGHSPSVRHPQPSSKARSDFKHQNTVTEKPGYRPQVGETTEADKLLLHAKDEIKRLKAELHEKERQSNEVREQLEEALSNMQGYQENCEQWQLSIDQIKDERDKALKECEELTKKDSEMTAKNEQLTQECRRYLEEFKRMEELIENLKREIDQRNRQVKGVEATGTRVGLSRFYPASRLLNRAKLLDNCDNFESLAGSVVYRDQSSKSSQNAVHHPQLKKATPLAPFADVREKRKGSYMSAFPLIIFSPDPVQQQLFDFLLEFFDDCQREDDAGCTRHNSADNAADHEVICEKKLSDGSKYRVTIGQLKKCLKKSKSAVLLPAVHVSAILSLRQQDIEPLVVVIKFKNAYDCTELSAIEELLDHHGHYETVVVPESLASDFPHFCQHVLHAVCHLVDKYTFLIGLGCNH